MNLKKEIFLNFEVKTDRVALKKEWVPLRYLHIFQKLGRNDKLVINKRKFMGQDSSPYLKYFLYIFIRDPGFFPVNSINLYLIAFEL